MSTAISHYECGFQEGGIVEQLGESSIWKDAVNENLG